MVLEYSYPGARGLLAEDNRRRAVNIIRQAQLLGQRMLLPRQGGTYQEWTYRNSQAFTWKRNGFDIVPTLEKVPGPMFEIGGPTRVTVGAGIPTWDEHFFPHKYNRPWFVSGYFGCQEVPAMLEYTRDIDVDMGPFGGTLALAADGSELPLRSDSISAVFAQAIHTPLCEAPKGSSQRECTQTNRVLHVLMIEEAHRVLAPGGLFFYYCTDIERALVARAIGFTVEQYDWSWYRRRWRQGGLNAVFSKY